MTGYDADSNRRALDELEQRVLGALPDPADRAEAVIRYARVRDGLRLAELASRYAAPGARPDLAAALGRMSAEDLAEAEKIIWPSAGEDGRPA